MSEQVHDYHHDKHSLPSVALLFVVFLDEWLKALLGIFAQLIMLYFDVVHSLFLYALHMCVLHSHVHLA